MKKINCLFLIVALFTLSVFSCKKDTADTTSKIVPFTGLSHNLKGVIKGVLKQDTTYYLDDNVTINKGDTLTIQPGAIVKSQGNYSFFVSGNFICVGTDAKPITLTTSFASPVLGYGYWGGIQADSSALNVKIKFTHIDWTGGPAADLSTQAAVDIEGTQAHDYGAKIIIEDNWFFGSVDDGIHLAGQIHASVKRNVLQHLGVAHHTRDELAGGIFRVKTGGQMQQMPEQPRPQIRDRAAGGPLEEIDVQIAGQPAQKHDAGDCGNEQSHRPRVRMHAAFKSAAHLTKPVLHKPGNFHR